MFRAATNFVLLPSAVVASTPIGCENRPERRLGRAPRQHRLSKGIPWAVAWLMSAVVGAGMSGCGNFSAAGKNAEGVRMFQQARYEEALRLFQQARYDDPSNADAHYNIAATLHEMAMRSQRLEDAQQAEQAYRMCLDRDPNHREAYRGLAVLLTRQGRTDEAFALLQRWVDQQPASADARIELARLCDETGRKPAAENLVLQALSIEPNNARALTALGKLREEAGRHAEALAAYQRSYMVDNRQTELPTRIASLQTLLPASAWPTAPAGPPTTAPGSPAAIMAGRPSPSNLVPAPAGPSNTLVGQSPWR